MSKHPANPTTEKFADVEERSVDSDRYTEGHGDLQIIPTGSTDSNLKLAKDGRTVLIPQPSDNPDDPLNWSFAKKHIVLASMVFAALLTDFGMTYGTVLFQAQAPSFGISIPATAKSITGPLFLQGVGGIFAVPLIQRIGRLPVLFYSQFICAFMVLGAALSPNYATFTAFRCLQGFFNTAQQVVGLGFVFCFHERVKRINIWVFCLLGGPFFGPFVAAWLITEVDWRTDFGILAALHGFSTLLVVFLGDETLYDRKNPQPRERGLWGRFTRLTGIAGLKAQGRPGVMTVLRDLISI
ncbi:hypothetical protein LTR09_009603 [Extremus antarcticus]|uniref:Major facilitator superfamily (MFS) profile domain-containing protein n=1 Tax=Extremus antarcticus TaxID=702011 RepID=A0AAJ0G966_9PEZI|nr:hypothetical protein LTR09_009603 [Extremus antarcticus]